MHKVKSFVTCTKHRLREFKIHQERENNPTWQHLPQKERLSPLIQRETLPQPSLDHQQWRSTRS